MRLTEAEFAQRFPNHPLARRLAAEDPDQKRERRTRLNGAPRSTESILEALFAQQVLGMKLPTPSREYMFHDLRKWRFDFAWPQKMLAVEVEGGIWNQGRHTRSHGFIADTEKYNTALSMGWRVMRFTGPDIRSGEAVRAVSAVLSGSELVSSIPCLPSRRRQAAPAGG